VVLESLFLAILAVLVAGSAIPAPHLTNKCVNCIPPPPPPPPPPKLTLDIQDILIPQIIVNHAYNSYFTTNTLVIPVLLRQYPCCGESSLYQKYHKTNHKET